jgi:hypothetical protein
MKIPSCGKSDSRRWLPMNPPQPRMKTLLCSLKTLILAADDFKKYMTELPLFRYGFAPRLKMHLQFGKHDIKT